MRMDLILEILDVPGQLVSVLSPLGDLGANLVTVIHQRENKNEKGMVPIQLTLEGERENLNAVISTILYGHIIDTDVRDTVDKINAVEGLVVSALQFKLEGELASTALLTIEMDVGKREYAYEKVMEIAKEKDFLVIDEV